MRSLERTAETVSESEAAHGTAPGRKRRELARESAKRPTGAPGKIHLWKGMEAPYGESCWIT